ncbi:MAG TPA: ATP-binding protein [Thiotrichales bacterium]|nr:ATP-binding protein [Thiotrichales bacterium]
MSKHKPLTAEALYHRCSLDQFDFVSTSELTLLEEPLGQNRALEAINFGVDIDQDGFNLFVLGPPGLGKHQLVEEILSRRAAAEPELFDWCYVNNFDNFQKPRVLKLPAGTGLQLRKDMEQLIEDLMTALPSSFQSEEYRTRLQELEDEFNEQQEQTFTKLYEEAKERGVAVMRTPAGYTLAPLIEDELVKPEDFEKLPQKKQEKIEKTIADIQLQLRDVIRDLPLRQREHHKKVKALQKEITQLTIEQLIGWLEHRYEQQKEVRDYIARVKAYVIENAQDFISSDGGVEIENIKQRVSSFHEYQINVLVDNSYSKTAPVIYEDNPTYQNLIGRIEHVAQMGTLLTDFTLIKAGALHRANGGYLILDAHKVLTHAFAWDGLKRALSSHEVKIESLEKMLSLVSTISLEPESIALDVKVVLVGEPLLYYLLKAYDPEFSLLFKVAADFSEDTDRNEESTLLYARMIATLQNRHKINPLDRAGVARVIEQAARLADDGEKLSLRVETLVDLMREAGYWSKKSNSSLIRAEDVETALEKQRYRQDKIREKMQEQITRGIRLIDTEGTKIAQVNGLSVIQLGDYAFGTPSRITATARLGQGKVVDIEREVKLGGHIHSKGVLILSSYLANHYARDCPLPLSASLVFEQSYGMVDGDSASAAELCVLLSALGDIPLKQSLAVTGSISQLGEIQAIGGGNEKIEGYFDICRQRGLTGEQGVIIPAANQVHLMLNQEVRQAVAAEQFCIYTAVHVEDVMELLSGLSRGERDDAGQFPEGSFNWLVQDRIQELQELHRRYSLKEETVSEDENSDA